MIKQRIEYFFGILIMKNDNKFKVLDLIRILEASSINKRSLQDRVTVAVSSAATRAGGSPSVDIVNAYSGFDWEQGRFILIPEQKVMALDENGETELELFRKQFDERLADVWKLKRTISGIKDISVDNKLSDEQKIKKIILSLKGADL